MADYYSILNKTILNLASNTPEVRNAVYGKARSAIEKQLRNMNPTPAEHAVQAQLNLLEEAITLIESENSNAVAAPVEQNTPTAPVTPQPAAEVVPQAKPTVSTQPEPTPSAQSGVQPTPEPEPVVHAEPIAQPVPEPQPVSAPEPTQVAPEPAPVVPPTSNPQEPVTVAPAMDAQPAQAQAQVQSAQTAVTTEQPVPEVSSTSIPAAVVTPEPDMPATPQVEMSTPAVTEPQVPVAPAPVAESEIPPVPGDIAGPETAKPAKKSGIIGKILLILIVLALLIGGGFAAFTNWDSIKGSVENSLLLGTSETASNTQDENTGEKEPVKLGQDGEDTQVEPIEGTSADEGTTEIRVIEPEPQETTEAPQATQPAEEKPVSETQETAEVQATEAETTPATQTENTESAIVGEVAYLYEEGSGGSSATRSAGGVSWDIARESPGDALPPEPVIIGNINVAEKDLAAQVTIKRNIDEALSASHLIQLQFTLGPNFQDGSIENVARFVMKATEEARGEPLVAVPVKISDGKFLIALNNLQQAVDVNTLLLKDGAWIDIPVTYNNGKRALVTLEKGGTGERVFTEALNDWKNR